MAGAFLVNNTIEDISFKVFVYSLFSKAGCNTLDIPNTFKKKIFAKCTTMCQSLWHSSDDLRMIFRNAFGIRAILGFV